jgi:hypothetical protein
MIVDGQLFFEPLAGTAITVSTTSTNILDLSVGRDLGGDGYPAPMIVVSILASFASATASATLTVGVQGAPDNGAGLPGGYQTFQQTPPLPLGQLLIGSRPCAVTLDQVTEFPLTPILSTLTTTGASTTATVASATGLLQGMNIFGNANIVPGTTIASISGTTVTLSAAASASGTAVSTAFGMPQPKPRFLRLQYTVSATMTAGSIWAGIVLDAGQPALYPPGYTWPANA